jgi:hypothetical protein
MKNREERIQITCHSSILVEFIVGSRKVNTVFTVLVFRYFLALITRFK